MRTSIILLTYERPDALELALRGLARQTIAPDELIVTDDGSSPSTRRTVERFVGVLPCSVRFLTQEHRGGRMSRARNRGIAVARGDYLIFLDGDMVAARHFVEDHRAFAREGCFVQGSRVLASEAVTRELLATGRLEVGFFERGLERRRHALRSSLARWAWGRPHHGRRGAKSCNLALWREDLVRLNGFNEEMEGWGLEDGELVIRALRMGLRRRDLRMGGSAVHLWHAPHVLTQDNPNFPAYRRTLASGEYRCAKGLEGHLVPPAVGAGEGRPRTA
jgi:glycosyltransferase involved in cell wall biosynthesis